MEEHPGLIYAERESGPLKLDLYTPDGEGPHPLLVRIHGGAWLEGGREWVRDALRQVERGYAVASIDYRLTDVATHPAQIRDCRAAVRWLRANAGTYALDADTVAVTGDSAGGHLACLLGTAPDAAFGPAEVCPEASHRVDAVVAFYPPTHLPTIHEGQSEVDHAVSDSPESKLVGGPVLENPDVARAASPTTYVDGDEPPFLVVHGGADTVVPVEQSARLVTALAEADRDVTYRVVAGGGHGDFDDPAVRTLVDDFLDRATPT